MIIKIVTAINNITGIDEVIGIIGDLKIEVAIETINTIKKINPTRAENFAII